MKENKERYVDVYGCVYIITRTSTGMTKLTAYTCYGDCFNDKWYNSYKGAKIAMGRLSDGMWREEK